MDVIGKEVASAKKQKVEEVKIQVKNEKKNEKKVVKKKVESSSEDASSSESEQQLKVWSLFTCYLICFLVISCDTFLLVGFKNHVISVYNMPLCLLDFFILIYFSLC